MTVPSMPVLEEISDHESSWRLRLLEESDAEGLYATVAANREHLARWLPWAAGQTLEGTLAFIRSTRRQLANNDGFQTAIVEDGRIIGMVGFHGVSWARRSTSIGYWLAEGAQRRGIMTSAVRALAHHAFTVWQLNRVEIRAAVGNKRSRLIPERLGFRREGVLPKAELVGDRYVDHVVYAMLAGDWRSDSD
jgi:ribosomal-protein-serine acetyltransferase